MSTPNKFLWVNQNVSNTTCPKVQTILDCISECSSRKAMPQKPRIFLGS